MVSTPLKNISQNGNLPQIGLKTPSHYLFYLLTLMQFFEQCLGPTCAACAAAATACRARCSEDATPQGGSSDWILDDEGGGPFHPLPVSKWSLQISEIPRLEMILFNFLKVYVNLDIFGSYSLLNLRQLSGNPPNVSLSLPSTGWALH